jgi:imidazolonepropionase-like amidohydrolase
MALTLIKAARLIDGTGSPPLERGAMLLEDDTIREVGTEESVLPPEGADVEEIDYGDRTVLPGLIDCHVHLIGFGDGRAGDDLNTLPDEVLALQAARNARAHLYNGVTTVRDCGAKNRTTLMLRQAAEMGVTPAPRLLLSGRPVAIVGGHLGYFGVEATGPDQCRAAVRQLIKEGVDFIKITATGGSTRTSFPLRPSFDLDELRAICDEVHKFGKHTAAHCASSQGIANAVEAGVDTIIHGYHKEPDGELKFRPEIAERMARQGVFLNATLRGRRYMNWVLEDKAESEGLTEDEQAVLDRARREYDHKAECAARMKELGVRLVAGSDTAWGIHKMGAFQEEIAAHVEIGMSPMEAIVAATGDSARSCWIDDTAGTLEPAKRADVLVVDGDPSQDIDALWNVADVFQAGSRVDRTNYV